MTYPSYPPSYPTPAAPTGSARRGLAIASIALGVVPVIADLVRLVVTASLVGDLGSPVYDVVNAGVLVIAGLAAIAGLVLGILAVQPASGARVLGGIGVGLGAAAVWGVVFSLAYPVLFGAIAGY